MPWRSASWATYAESYSTRCCSSTTSIWPDNHRREIPEGILAAGASFLEKPFTAAGLATKVREVLDMPQEA